MSHVKIIIFSILFLLYSQSFANSSKIKDSNSGVSVVVIDAGHGGKDPGATVAGVKEKNVVLSIALKLGAEIEDNFPDVKVIYTRKSDVFIPLHKRADIANKNKADLFISIHANATDGHTAYGTETFVLGLHRNQDNLEIAKKENSVILLEDDYETTYEGFDPNLPESYIMFETMQEEYQEQSVLLASSIQNEFTSYAKRSDRSVKMAGFLVLRETSMPSVLIETGFLSNTKERNYLNSNTGQTQLAQAIFKAFKIYKTKIEDNSNFHVATTAKSKNEEEIQQLANTKTETTNTISSNHYYSVQILALSKKLNTIPANFKGERNIYRIDGETINRYYSGRFNTPEEAKKEQVRIKSKYPGAFVVVFNNNKVSKLK
jgi:N-acetylmuramoyl-L-alanine amidase